MALADKKMNGNVGNYSGSFGQDLANAMGADDSTDDVKLKMGNMGDAIVDLVISLKDEIIVENAEADGSVGMHTHIATVG